MNVVKLKTAKTGVRLNLDNPEGDRLAITECATYIKRRIKSTEAAAAWISAGEALANLKGHLKKNSPRGDNARVGWKKAFELGDFPFSRQTADKLITIHEFFGAPKGALSNLPASWKALHLIATKFKSAAVDGHVADGSISASTTESEILSLGKRTGVIKPKPTKTRGATIPAALLKAIVEAPKSERIAAVRGLMIECGLKPEDLVDA